MLLEKRISYFSMEVGRRKEKSGFSANSYVGILNQGVSIDGLH